jgi:hypothetical protein
MNQRLYWLAAVALAAAVAIAATLLRTRPPDVEPEPPIPQTAAAIRQTLFDEIQPVKLANCDLERFGEPIDGGYLMCGNLLGKVGAGYSYGINGFDGWGCDMSKKVGVAVHQYDCFNTTAPLCPGGRTLFHAECVAGSARVEDGRPFDTIASQFARNGDASKRIVMKIDVEGAEWDSFLNAPDEVLQRIDQLAVEFHFVEEAKYIEVVRKLKKHFHVAHLHFNNWSCRPNLEPFPAFAYEVLFVNKQIGVVEPGGKWPGLAPMDAPNNPKTPDCQK